MDVVDDTESVGKDARRLRGKFIGDSFNILFINVYREYIIDGCKYSTVETGRSHLDSVTFHHL